MTLEKTTPLKMYMCYRNVVIFHCHLSFHGFFFHAHFNWIRRIFKQSRTGEHRKCHGRQQIASWFVVSWELLLSFPIPSMGLVYLPIHLFDVYGKCKQIYHTWMLWVCSGFCCGCWFFPFRISKSPKRGPFLGAICVVRIFC